MIAVLRNVRWYLRELTGESRYDAHVARERAAGTTPLTRRQFERRHAQHAELRPGSRCC